MVARTWPHAATLLSQGGPHRSVGAALVRAAYLVQHELWRWPLIGLNRLLFGVFLASDRRRLERAELAGLVRTIRRRYRALQRQDLEHASAGIYPTAELFSAPLFDYARAAPSLARDSLRIARRARGRRFDDLPSNPALAELPPYYRRCFHWQTDGYLSDHSARVYDLGVEILFTGMADVMRRQVIATLHPLPSDASILDVGCGTGRLLQQLAAARPGSRLAGIDMSDAYVRHASARLSGRAELSAGNAEQLPYPDASFDAVVSVFVFHELPKAVRRRVLGEMMRVLRPGGCLIVEDAAQLNDSPDLAPVLDQFPRDLHEPFFAQYIRDSLETMFEQAGLRSIRSSPAFVAKVVSARKPK